MGRGQELLNLVKSIKQEKELQTVQEEIKEVIKPENLKAGVTAFGVEGNKNIVDTTDANMDYYGAKMLAGYNAYAQGRKVSGTMKSTKKDNLSYFAGTTKIINPESPDFILTKQFPSGTIKGAIKKISANAIDPTWIENKNICIRANYNPSLTYWPKDWRVEIAVCDKDHYFYFKNSSSEQPIYCCDASSVGQPYVLYNAFVDNLNDLTIDLWTKTEVAVSNYMNSNLGKIGTLYAYSRNKSLSTSGLTGSSGVPGSKNKLYIQKEVGANTEAAYVSSDYNSAYLDQLDESIIANAINLKPENIRKGETYLGVEGAMEIGIDTSDATAAATDICAEQTAYVQGQKITGSLETIGGCLISDAPKGQVYLNNNTSAVVFESPGIGKKICLKQGATMQVGAAYSKVAQVIGLTSDKIVEGNTILNVAGTAKLGVDTSDATATAEDIVVNKTAYVNGKKVIGTLSRSYGSSSIVFSDGIEVVDGLTLRFKKKFDEPEMFPKDSYFSLQADIDSLLSAIGLTADKIKAGETILGITGTYTGEDSSGVGHTGGEN